MNANLFYAAAALGAVVLYLMMERRPAPFRAALTVAGLAAIGLMTSAVARSAPAPDGLENPGPFWLHVLLSMVAVAGAARMVTHPRPVYAALYFVLVILAVAVNFLLLQAEFMAFALLIVYAGAILITYLFVLMLAQQSGDRATHGEDSAWYDRTPREPAVALVLAFVIVAATGDALFRKDSALPWNASPALVARAGERAWERLADMPAQLADEARAAATADAKDDAARAAIAGAKLSPLADGRLLQPAPDGATATAALKLADGTTLDVTLDGTRAPDNSKALGHALVAEFPVSLELAGVILLMALFGAVVLARRQMEMAEDERRAAAGLPRIGDDDALRRGGAA
ncbi:MAG: NADH-quinone oxidoreductase subunit J [Phycisphaerales bacterium]|jgi:NADH-quinone oxidoreductase subunit J